MAALQPVWLGPPGVHLDVARCSGLLAERAAWKPSGEGVRCHADAECRRFRAPAGASGWVAAPSSAWSGNGGRAWPACGPTRWLPRGATLFVLYAVATEDSSPTRVASYVVSGIGFLGGGVILREGFNVRGLNTAATLWCSAAVGVLAASGHLVFTLIATGTVVAIHLFGRPLGRVIDHDNNVEEDESLQPYLVQVICRPKSEKYARAQIVQHASSNDITLRGIHTGHATDDEITLTRTLAHGRPYADQARAAGGRTVPATRGSRGAVVRRRQSPAIGVAPHS